jgi:Sulfotransferase domain
LAGAATGGPSRATDIPSTIASSIGSTVRGLEVIAQGAPRFEAHDMGWRIRPESVTSRNVMIVWLASYPRSGDTFFRILLNRLYGIRTLSVDNDKFFEERGGDTVDVVGHVHSDVSIDELARLPEMYFVKTHELPRGDRFPTIYLVRDGRDTLVSYAHFILHFEPTAVIPSASFGTTLRDLIEHRGSFGGWGPHVLSWSARSTRAPTSFVRFEDLIRDPPGVLTESVRYVQPQMQELAHPRSIPEFSELHALLPEFFRKGQAGGWRAEMSNELQRLFWTRYGQAMSASGYAETCPAQPFSLPRLAASVAVA